MERGERSMDRKSQQGGSGTPVKGPLFPLTPEAILDATLGAPAPSSVEPEDNSIPKPRCDIWLLVTSCSAWVG